MTLCLFYDNIIVTHSLSLEEIMSQSDKLTIEVLKKKIAELEEELIDGRRALKALEAADFDVWENNFVTGDTYGTNKRLFQSLGYSDSERPDNLDDTFKYIHPDDLELAKKYYTDHFEGKSSSYHAEMRMRAKDGTWVWTSSYGRVMNRDINGGVTQFIGVSFNVDERRHMEESMRILAYTDSLTNLGNRRILFESGTHEIDRAIRYGHPLSLLMLDIDNFKNINDKYGHLAGDEVLLNLAACLFQVVRQIDLKIRFGGDEFVILLVETNRDEAIATAERLRYEIENKNFSIKEPITVSIGVTELKNIDNLESLIERCDDALYKAKESGKNQISTL